MDDQQAGNQESHLDVAALWEELLKTLRAGEVVDWEVYRTRCPEHLQELQRALPALKELIRLEGEEGRSR
ncbi:MAG: hypothetical protein ACYC6N_03960 [Pirellulaceae bacterium]